MVDYFKKILVKVNAPLDSEDRPMGPIVHPENPIMEAMMALSRPSVIGVHPAFPARSNAQRARHGVQDNRGQYFVVC